MPQFPEPEDLDVPYVDRIGDSLPKTVNQYSVANPHPGFGKDPNIVNELGHTKYPKMVYPDGPMTKRYVVVNNADEEAAAMGDVPETKKDGW